MQRILRFGLAVALAAPGVLAHADPVAAPPAPALSDDKRQALREFSDAYGIRAMWPELTAKIARDSMPRLKDAALADIDADALPGVQGKASAQARLDGLMPAARQEFDAALKAFDADELASYTAFTIYARYFETQEIRDMTAFFGSPTGRKMAALSPTILAESRKPGAHDVMAAHFTEAELDEIDAFARSEVGLKMERTTKFVRDETHDFFVARTEPVVQALARRLATAAERVEPAPVAMPASSSPGTEAARQ